MKNPKNRETTDREEMMCPRCQTEGLVENPAYVDEYNGRIEVVKATRCPNEECPYHRGLPEEKVEMQMPESNLIGTISEIFGADPKDLATFAVAIIIMLGMAWSYGIGPFGTETTTTAPQTTVETAIEGSVPQYQGSYPEVILYQDNETVESVSSNNGTYNFGLKNATTGVYDIFLNYSGVSYNPPGKTVQIQEGEQQGNITANFDERPRPVNVSFDQSSSRSEFLLNHSNPKNIRSFDMSISPIKGETVERERELNTERDQNVLLPVFPSSQEYEIDAPYTVEEFATTETYRGQPESYEVFGNSPAEQIKIELPNGTEADSIVRTVDVPPSGTQETISIASEETLGPVEVTMSNGTSSDREQTSGLWEGQDNATIKTGTDEFVQGTLQIEPEPIETDQRIEGTISGTEIGHEFKGNVPIEDAKIEFIGGDIKASLAGTADISLDAQDGTTEEKVKELTSVDSDGSYRLEWNPSITGSQYADTYYQIGDGQKQSINSKGERTLSLEEGQTVKIGGRAELETMVPDQDQPRSAQSLNPDIEVVDVSFSKENPSPGEKMQVQVTIENTGPTEVSDTVQLFQNHELFSDEQVSVSPGEQQTLGLFEFGEPTASSSTGVEVWYVNGRGPYLLNVGINERSYAVGNLEADLYNVGTEGEVLVDTNSTGNFDCEVDASGGICEFDQLEPGLNSIPVEEVGVSGTSYVIEYTSQENPRGIKVDVLEDGLVDLEVPGVLTEAESESIELSPNESVLGFESENQIPFSYGLTWQSDAVIDEPVVDIDGDVAVADQGTFVKDKTFQVGSLSQGEHTFRFRSQTGGYTAKIEWREEEEQSYPRAIIDNQVACEPPQFANNLTCIAKDGVGYQPGTHSVEFDQAPSEIFNFKVEQKAVAVATNVIVEVDGKTSETFTRSSLEPEPWEQVSSTSDLNRGENIVSVNVEEENNIVPKVNLDYNYLLDTATVEQLDINVINRKTGETNTITLPEERNSLLQNTTVTIKEEWLSDGENIVRFEPQPVDGIFEIGGEMVINENDQFEFRTLR